jgi:hypothetical protein
VEAVGFGYREEEGLFEASGHAFEEKAQTCDLVEDVVESRGTAEQQTVAEFGGAGGGCATLALHEGVEFVEGGWLHE